MRIVNLMGLPSYFFQKKKKSVSHTAVQPENVSFCHSLFLISTTFYLMNSERFLFT